MKKIIYTTIISVLLGINHHALSATSTQIERISEGGYISPAWISQAFEGTHYRDLTQNSLVTTLEQVEGGFDTAATRASLAQTVDEVHEDAFVEGRLSVSGIGTGNWWFGPKISVNWVGGNIDGSEGWYENYIIDNATWTPEVMDGRLTGEGKSYLGTTEHDGAVYKHYLVPHSDWLQFWAVRQTYRTGGATSIKPILNFWRENGLPNKRMDGIRINFETNGTQSRTFIVCDFYVPSPITSAPSKAYPTSNNDIENDTQECGSLIGFISGLRNSAQVSNVEDFEDAGFIDIDQDFLQNYTQKITASANSGAYSNPPTLEAIQSDIDNINILAASDNDQDSIADLNDLCLTTSFGLSIDTNGCPTIESIVAASDSPANGGFKAQDLKELGIKPALEQYIADYEVAIANQSPLTFNEIEEIVLRINIEKSGIVAAPQASNLSGGGGSLGFIFLLLLTGIKMSWRYTK